MTKGSKPLSSGPPPTWALTRWTGASGPAAAACLALHRTACSPCHPAHRDLP